jgi:hypothetical protein
MYSGSRLMGSLWDRDTPIKYCIIFLQHTGELWQHTNVFLETYLNWGLDNMNINCVLTFSVVTKIYFHFSSKHILSDSFSKSSLCLH